VGTRRHLRQRSLRGYVSAYDDNAPDWATARRPGGPSTTPPLAVGRICVDGLRLPGRADALTTGLHQFAFRYFLIPVGSPKDNFWYYRSCGRTPRCCTASALELARQRRADNRRPRAEHCDEVELFLNARALASRPCSATRSSNGGEIPPGILVRQGQQGRQGRRRGKDRDHRRTCGRATAPVGRRLMPTRGCLHHHCGGCR